MSDFISQHLDALVTGIIGLLCTLLAIKYGKHKPSPKIEFIKGEALAIRTQNGKYRIIADMTLANTGDASVLINNFRMNGIDNSALYNFRKDGDEKAINCEYASDVIPSRVTVELFAPNGRRVFKRIFREVNLQ